MSKRKLQLFVLLLLLYVLLIIVYPTETPHFLIGRGIKKLTELHFYKNYSHTSEDLSRFLPTIQILAWSSSLTSDWSNAQGYLNCGPLKFKCQVTSNRKYLPTADAVLFHANDLNNLQGSHGLPKSQQKPSFQRWIYYSMDSPMILRLDQQQIIKDYLQNKFDWIMNYMKEADITVPHGYVFRRKYSLGIMPNISDLSSRPKMIVTVINRCYPHRMNIINELKKLVDVDVYGRCGKPCPSNKTCWQYIKSHYKFYLSFENSICNGYLSWRTYSHAYENFLIPIIISGADYSNQLVIPPNSYIDALKFANVRELANYIQEVANSVRLYHSYFKWHEKYDIQLQSFRNSLCNACQKIAQAGPRSANSQPYQDLSLTLGPHDDNCKEYPDPYLLNTIHMKFNYHRNE